MVVEATISSKNQIVIPAAVRKALNVKSGDKILFNVTGSKIAFLEKPTSYSKAIRGIARGVYPPDYLRKERADWD